MSTFEELKKEADDLGINYPKNVTPGRLQEKIEEFYSEKEKMGTVDTVKAVDDTKPTVDARETKRLSKRVEREKAARKTRIVTIIDNDQRVNNQTTTCTVNCSNEFFDLGTVILPLNEKIEVSVGHIRTLEEVKIPHHVRDSKTGLSEVRIRPRYTISYEDKQ